MVKPINIPRPVVLALRGVELISGGVVAGIVGYYLYPFAQNNERPANRFIFTETLAVISVILSIVWLIPKLVYRIPWWADFLLSIGWWTAFGLIVAGIDCGNLFPLRTDSFCASWRAVQSFSVISAGAWFVTGLFGVNFVQQRGGRRRQRFY